MREIVLDTETTGLDPLAGHRVVELGCIELDEHGGDRPHLPRLLQSRDARCRPARRTCTASRDEFLADKPRFAEKVEEFLEFVGDAQLVIHNAQFDIGFLNAELRARRQGRS